VLFTIRHAPGLRPILHMLVLWCRYMLYHGVMPTRSLDTFQLRTNFAWLQLPQVSVLYSATDAGRLERVVGTPRVKKMMTGGSRTFLFV